MMARNNHQMFVVCHRNMFTLTEDIKPSTLQGSHDSLMRDLRQVAHTLTSTVLNFLSRFKSSMLSRYSLIASLMFSNASSSVSPWETHPWRVGQEITYPPASGSCSKTTGYSMWDLTVRQIGQLYRTVIRNHTDLPVNASIAGADVSIPARPWQRSCYVDLTSANVRAHEGSAGIYSSPRRVPWTWLRMC